MMNRVCLISILRLLDMIEGFDNFANPAFNHALSMTQITYWTLCEINLAICVACAMTLKPLVARLFPSLVGPSVGNNSLLTIGSRPTRGIERVRERDDSVLLDVTPRTTKEEGEMVGWSEKYGNDAEDKELGYEWKERKGTSSRASFI